MAVIVCAETNVLDNVVWTGAVRRRLAWELDAKDANVTVACVGRDWSSGSFDRDLLSIQLAAILNIDRTIVLGELLDLIVLQVTNHFDLR
jgi:hypothetical protein